MSKKKKRANKSLDLHGFRVDEVFDAVDAFVMKNQNQSRLEILCGKGTGKVRTEVLRYLKLGGFPWEYEQLDNGQRNTGSIIVHTGD